MRLVAGLLLPLVSYAATGGTAIDRGVRELELDRAECYRVHDVQVNKDDIHLYFTDGYLIFAKPVEGTRMAAVFTADVEAGDGEVLLLPPDRSERRSLTMYTGSPNLDEHIDAAVLLFGDDTYGDLMRQITANEFNRPKPEMGAMMAERWTPVVRNLASSFEARLVLDLLNPRERQQGCFVAAVHGKKLGNFDVIYEPRQEEQMVAGQVTSRDSLTFFDVWTSFTAAPDRKGLRKPPEPELTLQDYRIDATVAPDLRLRVITKAKVTMTRGGDRVLPVYITPGMHVSSVTIDGEPAEVLEPESMRSNLLRNDGNDLFLVVARHPLDAGRDYELEFHHEGAVVHDAGNQCLLRRRARKLVPQLRNAIRALRSHISVSQGAGPGDARRHRVRYNRGRAAYYAACYASADSLRRLQPGDVPTRARGTQRFHRGGVRKSQRGSCARSQAADPAGRAAGPEAHYG